MIRFANFAAAPDPEDASAMKLSSAVPAAAWQAAIPAYTCGPRHDEYPLEVMP